MSGNQNLLYIEYKLYFVYGVMLIVENKFVSPVVLQITSKIAVFFITVQYNVTITANGKSQSLVSWCLVFTSVEGVLAACLFSCKWFAHHFRSV